MRTDDVVASRSSHSIFFFALGLTILECNKSTHVNATRERDLSIL